MRSALTAALVACVESSFRGRARRFLSGLSSDELQFIAEYLGSRILEPAQPWEFRPARCAPEDRDLKVILLLEYLGCCHVPQPSRAAVRTA